MDGSINKYKIATSFVKGKGHEEKNIPCQDRVYSHNDEKIGIICLSDGAGSCEFSEEGSEITTTATIEYLQENFDDLYNESNDEKVKQDILINIFLKLQEKIIEKNNSFKKNEKEIFQECKKYSSTLLFVAVKDNNFLIGHLGDGLIGYLDKNNHAGIESEPKNAEYANTTFFVTDFDGDKNMKLYKGNLGEKIGFIIMSDGVSPSILDKQSKTLSSVVNQMFDWLEDNDCETVSKALENNIENIFKKRTSDDCSIGIIKIVSDEQVKDKVPTEESTKTENQEEIKNEESIKTENQEEIKNEESTKTENQEEGKNEETTKTENQEEGKNEVPTETEEQEKIDEKIGNKN